MFERYRLWLTVSLLAILICFSPAKAVAAEAKDLGAFAPGGSVTVSSDGGGYAAGETVRVTATAPDGRVISEDAIVDDSGSWSCVLALPGDAPEGGYSYSATGVTSGATQSGTFTVAVPLATSLTSPWIQSDQDDYAPASTVTLTSGGWQPGESVTVFVNDAVGQTWQITQQVAADGSGAFTFQFVLPDTFVAQYNVTAMGAANDMATTSFTDAIGSISPVSGPEGAAFTLTVNRSGGLSYTTNTRIVFGGVTLPTTLVNGSQLTASVPATLVLDEGTKAVTTTNPTGGPVNFTVTEGDSFTLTPHPISATTNVAFSGAVATLTDSYDNTATGTFAATIDWNDGSAASAGTVTRTGPGTYSVTGSHTWTTPFEMTSVKTATAYPASTIPVANSGTTNFASSGTIVVFTGSGYETLAYTGKTGGTSASFTGVTGWTGSGTLAVGNPITQPVRPVTVTVSENSPGSASATTSSPVTLTDGMTYVMSTGPFSTSEGQVYTGSSPFFPGSIFTGADFPNVGLYRLLVSNGTSSAWYTLYTSGPNNYMYPNSTPGQVVFGDEGTVPYTETLYRNDGTIAGTSGNNVTVTDAGLSYFFAVNTYHVSEGASTGSIQIGKFLDSYVGDGDHSADFTVTVHWGDGHSDTVPAVFVGANAYTVSGTHTYAEEGTYTATYDVVDDGGSHITGVSTAIVGVSDPAVSVTGASLTTTYGVSLGTHSLATFTDPGGAEPNDGTHYSATVDWGDGFGSTAGTISYSTSVFTVSAAVPYTAAGSYSPTITVTHELSTAQQVTDSISIGRAPLTIKANDITKTFGDLVTFTGTEFSAVGLVNGDGVTSVTLTSSGAAANASVAGSPYDIVPSNAMPAAGTDFGNYDITYKNGKLTVNPATTSVAATVTPTPVQYSDVATLKASVTPTQVAGSQVSGNVQFYVSGVATGSPVPVNSNGVATLARTIGLPAGSYSVTASFTATPGGNFKNASGTTNLVVTQEDGSIVSISPDMVKVPSGATNYPVTMSGVATQAADGSLGDLTKIKLNITLTPIGGGSVLSASNVAVGANGSFSNTFPSVPVGVYDVAVTLGTPNLYFTLPEYDTALVVYDPTAGFATGGGWFKWPGTGEKTSFGFVTQYGKSGSNFKGQLVMIRHMPDGSLYRLKSNSCSGLAITGNAGGHQGTVSFTGKATYNLITPSGGTTGGGNYSFSMYAEDNNEPGTGVDAFKMTLAAPSGGNPAGFSVPLTPLSGGNIQVPHQ